MSMASGLGTLGGVRATARIAIAVVRRPGLWRVAARQARRTARPGWWKCPPFLPVPAPEYLEFRMLTQYGAPDAHLSAADVVSYLEWCRQYG